MTITGFDLKSYRQCLQKWNSAITGKHIYYIPLSKHLYFNGIFDILDLPPVTEFRIQPTDPNPEILKKCKEKYI